MDEMLPFFLQSSTPIFAKKNEKKEPICDL